MSLYQGDKALEALSLGKETQYHTHYDASLLQGVPRRLNRDSLSLTADNLPFMVVISGQCMSYLGSTAKVYLKWLLAM